MRANRYIPDAIGLLVLAVVAGLVAWFVAAVYGSEAAVWAFGIGFPVLAICSLFAWHSEKWPEDTGDVFVYAWISVPVGMVSFLIDAMISTSMYPRLPFRDAIWHAGSPFGIVLTIAICPGFSSIALAGAARAFFVAGSATQSGN